MDFWKSPGAIITIIILASIVTAGALSFVNNIGLNNRKNTEGGESGTKVVKTDPSHTPTSTPGTISDTTVTPTDVDISTPTPTPTQPQGTSTPTSTPTQPRSASTPAPTPNLRRFTIEESRDLNTGIPRIQIKLDNEVIKELIRPGGCGPNKLDDIPVPVTSRDGTKVYYVDPLEPTKVKEINNNKQEREFFNPARQVGLGYKYVAGLAINSRDQVGYTLLKDTPDPCLWPDVLGNRPIPKSAFYINSKLIEYSDAIKIRGARVEIITDLGDNFFLTKVYPVNLEIGGSTPIPLRNTSDGRINELYERQPRIYHRNVSKGLVILSIDYPKLSEQLIFPSYDQVVKIELNGSGKSDLIKKEGKNIIIKNIEIVDKLLRISYGLYEKKNNEWVSVETRTVEYSL